MSGTGPILRRQPPVLTPLTINALASAFMSALMRDDQRETLREKVKLAYNAEFVTLLGSGTQALETAIRIGVSATGPKTVVALPAFSCYDIASAAIGAGHPVTFYDVRPDTLAPEPESLRAAMEDGARVIVIAPFYGIPVDWDALHTMAREYDAYLIEDAAQSHGGIFRGRRLGSIGALSVISFGKGKGWTGGGGGALLVRSGVSVGDHEPDATGNLGLGGLARATAQWVLARPSLYALPASMPFLGLGETQYHAPAPPRGLPIAAAVLLLRTFDIAERAAAERRAQGRQYSSLLNWHTGMIRVPDEADPGYLRYPLRVRNAEKTVRDLGALGVARTFPQPLPRLPELQGLIHDRLAGREWPGASTLVDQLVTLPTHGLIRKSDVARIVEGVSAVQI